MSLGRRPPKELRLRDRVRLRARIADLEPGVEGEVVGFYHSDPPRVLVRFENRPAVTVPVVLVERVA